jgi:hypothetical protein
MQLPNQFRIAMNAVLALNRRKRKNPNVVVFVSAMATLITKIGNLTTKIRFQRILKKEALK